MSTDHDGTEKRIDIGQWISQAQAAKLRGVTRQAIARLVKKGRFKTLSIGGKTLLRRSEVEGFQPKPPGPIPKGQSQKRE
jgi:excisionase family DNA binding protein